MVRNRGPQYKYDFLNQPVRIVESDKVVLATYVKAVQPGDRVQLPLPFRDFPV
jgi:hypothetical protein